VHQRLRHQHAALHAAGELAHVGLGLVGEAELGQQLVDPGVVAAHAEVAALDAQRLAHAEEGVEHQLLRHDAQLSPRRGVVGDDIVAEHRDAAAAGARKAREDGDERRLARAVGPEQAEELALADVEAHLVQRAQRALGTAKGLGDVVEADGDGGIHEARNCRKHGARLPMPE